MSDRVPVGIDAIGVSIDVDGVRIVSDAALSCPPGSFVGLIGPNGSGKSTLLRAVYRNLRPRAGRVTLGTDDVWALSARHAAQRMAVVTQDGHGEFDFTVDEIVALGRVPHQRLLDRETATDRAIAAEALACVGMTFAAERAFSSLSGGERQRVLIARALAQQPQVLVLDEPTNHLDVSAQIELLALVGSLPTTVLAALHDLNLAAAYCDHLVVMRDGRTVASGPPDAVLDETLIADVYGVEVRCLAHPITGRRLLAFGSALRPPHVPHHRHVASTSLVMPTPILT